MDLPCGQCIGCRLERSRQWALRCVHESELHDDNSFITLTYDDKHLPPNGSLCLRDFQLFMKRLRKQFPQKFKFFHCGEYGENLGRPHYHACLFGLDFSDKVPWSSSTGHTLYRSADLERIWELGNCWVGDVTFDSAAYVARYITKKVTGDEAPGHYGDKVPEYITMSRRPGIGSDWFKRFRGDVYPDDFVVCRGVKMRPPKFYDGLYSKEDPVLLEELKRDRLRRLAQSDPLERDSYRLRVKETVKRSTIRALTRKLEVSK